MSRSRSSASQIAPGFRRTPSWIADSGQMSLTLNTNGARLNTENAIAARPIGSGGGWTKKTAVPTHERRDLRVQEEKQERVTNLLKEPAVGGAETHQRLART